MCWLDRDGTSRVGVYFAANACIEQVIQHGEVDVFQAVKNVRRHRPQLVENLVSFLSIFFQILYIDLIICMLFSLYLSYRPNSNIAMTWFFTTSFTIYIEMAPKSERFTMLINFDSIVGCVSTLNFILYRTRRSIQATQVFLTFNVIFWGADYCQPFI